MIITIDGPAASGKSSVAQKVAVELGLYYLCSGMLYRACAYILHKYAGYSSERSLHHVRQEDVTTYCNIYRIRYVYTIHGVQIFFDDHDITSHLKTEEIDHYVSIASAQLVVRTAVLVLQRAITKDRDLVADGRDMGSVAFPDATYKFFLTASAQERAQRWQKDQHKLGNQVSLEQAMQAVSARDQNDTVRAHAPLVVPHGAITIDNTGLNLDETVQRVLGYVNEHEA